MLKRVTFDVVISDQQAPAVDDSAVEVAERAFTDSGIRKEEHDAQPSQYFILERSVNLL